MTAGAYIVVIGLLLAVGSATKDQFLAGMCAGVLLAICVRMVVRRIE